MNLREYIDKYRRGNNALTSAEAKIAGISYPMPSGWVKRYSLLEVDGEAMYDAKLQRHRAVAARKADGPKKPSKKESKKDLRARLVAMQALLDTAPAMAVANAPPKPRPRPKPNQKPNPENDEFHAWVNSSAFLASFEWRQLRFSALRKYGPRCQCCGATPADGAVMNVDHIKPRRNFPDLALDIDNLQILCGDCNHGKGNLVADFRAG
jgi:hypothetical protein